MSIPTIITILQWLFSLTLGLYLSKKIRPHLRKLILRLMPLKYRFSEEFFGLQNRITTTVLLLVAASIITFCYLLTGKVEKEVTQFSFFSTTSESEIYPFREEAQVDFDPGHSLIEDTLPENRVLPKVAELDQPLTETTFFLQLYAFQHLERAQVQQSYWSGRLSKKVKIVIVEESPAPYKVWVGPFATRSEARKFNQKYQLGGFIIQMPH